ncbi:hypothetical protein PTKIN_Ptkin02bG0001700 [Pterospermum kingtungense]
MEDCNMLVADCIAISCCTQCLILQIIIFVLLKLPCKLIRKTKEYAKKKLGRRKMIKIERVEGGIQDKAVKLHTSTSASMSMELIQGLGGGEGHGFRCCCIEEAEEMLEKLRQKGEFAFGSFWGRSESEGEAEAEAGACSAANANEGYDFVRYELIEIACFS